VLNFLSRIFLTGLFTVLPVLATIYLLVWLFSSAEALMGDPLKTLLLMGYMSQGWDCWSDVALSSLLGY